MSPTINDRVRVVRGPHTGRVGDVWGVGLRAGWSQGVFEDRPDWILVKFADEENPFTVTGCFPFPPDQVERV
jgi:hypothetical protein